MFRKLFTKHLPATVAGSGGRCETRGLRNPRAYARPLSAAVFLFIALLLSAGCASSRTVKVVQGVNMELGIVVPGTEGALTLDLLSYTSGFKAAVPTNTPFCVELSSASTNDYFGVIHIREAVMATVKSSEDIDESPPK